jgi:plasmid maintenance system antidote protein VapI
MLRDWIRTHGITVSEAARRLRLSHVQVGHLIRGIRGVSLDSALRIQSVAGVPAEAWTDMEGAEHGQG